MATVGVKGLIKSPGHSSRPHGTKCSRNWIVRFQILHPAWYVLLKYAQAIKTGCCSNVWTRNKGIRRLQSTRKCVCSIVKILVQLWSPVDISVSASRAWRPCISVGTDVHSAELTLLWSFVWNPITPMFKIPYATNFSPSFFIFLIHTSNSTCSVGLWFLYIFSCILSLIQCKMGRSM